ncbi:MAG: hypothetical protein IJ804_05450 [Prevotella sp.]|nr:hypothetical protein [Prevotella sp.]
MNRLRILLIVVGVFVAQQGVANTFRTTLLERMAMAIGIVSSELPANSDMDSVAVVKNKPIHVRTNAWGDVVHIGYSMFNSELVAHYHNPYIFDFIERYLLELDLGLDKRDIETRMRIDCVTMVKGRLWQLRSVTPLSDIKLTIDEKERKMYRLNCTVAANDLSITIPADCQLLLGANAIELEKVFSRSVKHFTTIVGVDTISDLSSMRVSIAGKTLVTDGDFYMSKAIRNSLYLREDNGVRKLICSPKLPSRSISNIMLTGVFANELPMELVLNRYGNQRDTLDVTLQQFIAYCKQEGATLYFGIKELSEEILRGTLFAYNANLACTHMLSVEFPFSLLEGGKEKIRATTYVYIPLGHIADTFFIDDYNPTLLYD